MSDTVEFVFGTVKWFDSRNEKRFGFIVVEGQDIFFHQNDAGRFTHNGREVHWLSRGWTGVPFSLPAPGDQVVFQTIMGKMGRLKAYPWGYKNDFDQVQSELQQHLDSPVFRFYEHSFNWGDSQTDPHYECLAEGRLDELKEIMARRHPETELRSISNTDTDQLIFTERWFEVKKILDPKHKVWEKCEDPLIVVQEATQV